MKTVLLLLTLIGSNYAFELLKDNQKLKFLLWPNNKESLALHGKRGLGGGLEYQISNSFCNKIRPLFIDNINCEELDLEIRNGLNNWTNAQSKIRFVRLDSSFKTVVHEQNAEYLNYDQSELGLIKSAKSFNQSKEYSKHGAEIDFHTIDSWDKNYDQIAFFAYADLIWGNEQVDNLIGQKIHSSNLISTDIFFNTDPKICYYRNSSNLSNLSIPNRCKKVLKFSFVVTHEVGHTLGLDHIKENETIMGKSDDTNPIYEITKVDEYHLRRLYPSHKEDLEIINSYEDEFMKDDTPEPDYR